MTLVEDRFANAPQTAPTSELNDDDFEFTGDLSSIDPLSSETQSVTYPNPNGKPFRFDMRQLTALEATQISRSSLPTSVLMKATDEGLTDAEMQDLPEVIEAEYNAKIASVVMGCTRPTLTRDQVERYPSDLVDRLFAAVKRRSAPTAVDTFPPVDSDQ